MAKNNTAPAAAAAAAAVAALPFELEDVALPTGRSSGFVANPDDPIFKMLGALPADGSKTFFVPAAQADAAITDATQREAAWKENAAKLVNAIRSKVKTYTKKHEGTAFRAVVSTRTNASGSVEHGARVGRVEYKAPEPKPAAPAIPAPAIPSPAAPAA